MSIAYSIGVPTTPSSELNTPTNHMGIPPAKSLMIVCCTNIVERVLMKNITES